MNFLGMVIFFCFHENMCVVIVFFSVGDFFLLHLEARRWGGVGGGDLQLE